MKNKKILVILSLVLAMFAGMVQSSFAAYRDEAGIESVKRYGELPANKYYTMKTVTKSQPVYKKVTQKVKVKKNGKWRLVKQTVYKKSSKKKSVKVYTKVAGNVGTSQEDTVESVAIALANQTQKGNYGLIDTAGVKQMIDAKDDFVLLDSMPESWFNGQHIPTAVNAWAPLSTYTGNEVWTDEAKQKVLDVVAAAADGDKDKTVVVYCGFTKCTRSHEAAAWLVENGYTNVLRYVGGISAWVDAGNEVVKTPELN